MNRKCAGAAIAALAVALTACGAPSNGGGGGGGGGTAAGGGGGSGDIIVAATGPNSGAEFNPGPQSTKNQFQALINAWNAEGGINGRKLKLEFFDTQSSAATAATLVPKIKASGAKAVFACCFAPETVAVTTPLKNTGPIVFNTAPPLPTPANSYVFDAAPPATAGLDAAEKFIGLKKYKNVAMLTDTTAGEADARKAITAGGSKYGYAVKTSQVFDVSSTSVSTQLAKVQAVKPDAIVLWSTGPQVATVFSGLKAAGMGNIPVILADGNVNRAILAKFANSFPNEVYAPGAYYLVAKSSLTGDTAKVLASFLKAEGFKNGQNDNVASYLVDNVGVVVNALRKLGGNASNEKIKDYVQSLTGFEGVNGKYSFSKTDHRGIAGDQTGMIRIAGKTLAFTAVTDPGVTKLTTGS